MSAGAITLQCPECGGVFLTLQHTGQTEICPHCAVSGPRANFRKVTDPTSQRERADLPAKMEAVMAGVAAASRMPVLDSPFPLAPESFMASPAMDKPGTPTSSPSADSPVTPYKLPDVPPLPAFQDPGYKNGQHLAEPAVPPSAPEVNRLESILPISDFPSAKAIPSSPLKNEQKTASPGGPVWPGLDLDEAASQAADAPPPTSETPSTTEPRATSSTKAATPAAPAKKGRAGSRLALVSVLLLGAGWLVWQKTHLTSAPDSAPSEPLKPALVTAQKSAGPIRPETTPPKPATSPSGQTIPPPAVASKLPTVASAPAPVVPPITPPPSTAPLKPKTQDKPEVAIAKSEPVKPEPPKTTASKLEVPKPAIATVKPEVPKPVAPKPEVAATKPEPPKVEAPKPAVSAVKPEAPKPEVGKVEPPKPVATTPTPPLEVTRPAQPALAPVTESTLQEAATKSATVLNASTPATDKLAVISEPGRYLSEIEQFFKAHASLKADNPEASSGKVVVLPGGEDAKVFRMVTHDCPEGALLYFHTNDGKVLLDWPLFKQSHDKTYDNFVTNPNNAATPQWFSALCRRTHTTALKGAAKDEWISLDAQGSLANTGAAVVYFDKNSLVGRYLDQKLTWERIYLVNLRLGKKILEGQSVNIVLECLGAKP